MTHQRLYINGVFKATDPADILAVKMEAMATEQLNAIPDKLKTLQTVTFPLLPYNVLGIEKLRSLFDTALQKQLIEKNQKGYEQSN